MCSYPIKILDSFSPFFCILIVLEVDEFWELNIKSSISGLLIQILSTKKNEKLIFCQSVQSHFIFDIVQVLTSGYVLQLVCIGVAERLKQRRNITSNHLVCLISFSMISKCFNFKKYICCVLILWSSFIECIFLVFNLDMDFTLFVFLGAFHSPSLCDYADA